MCTHAHIHAHTHTHRSAREQSAPYLDNPPILFPSLEASPRLDLGAHLNTLSPGQLIEKILLSSVPTLGVWLYLPVLKIQLRVPPDQSFHRRTPHSPRKTHYQSPEMPRTLTRNPLGKEKDSIVVKLPGEFRKLKAIFTFMRKILERNRRKMAHPVCKCSATASVKD